MGVVEDFFSSTCGGDIGCGGGGLAESLDLFNVGGRASEEEDAVSSGLSRRAESELRLAVPVLRT